MNKSSEKVAKRQNPNDIFYTPSSAVDVHLNLLNEYVCDGDMILDPFFGDGKYFNKFSYFNKNNSFDWTEIALGKDFYDYSRSVDVICSNPPYSCIDQVLEKSVSLNPHTISYLIGFTNLTTKRIEFMNKHGYNLVKMHLTKIYKWFGMSAICIFTKSGNNCISFDRKVHR